MAGATIDEIRERNDVVDVVGGYVNLTKAGARLRGLCPFHQEKTPSFMVNPEKQFWHCFGCHEGGDVFTFVMKMEKMSFPEAAEHLASRAGLTFSRSQRTPQEETRRQKILRANIEAERFFHSILNDTRGSHGLTKWQERGVDEGILQQYRLGYAPDSWDSLWTYLQRHKTSADIAEAAGLIRRRNDGTGHYDYFRNRLIVPIRDVQGRVIGFGGRALGDDPAKYINSPENEVFSKRAVLFGLDLTSRAISEADAAIVVEGYMDQIALHQYGFVNSVATMGTAITPEHLSRLVRYTRNLYIAYDADSAGMNAILRSAGLFEEQEMSVRIVEIPDGLDPDDLVRKRGAESMRQAVDSDVSLVDYRIRQAIRQFSENKSAGRLSEDEYTAQMILSAVPIIAEIVSPVQREALAVKLAQEWCSPDLQRVTRAAEAIRREVDMHRRRRTRSEHAGSTPHSSRRPQPTAAQRPASSSESPTISMKVRGIVRAERDLLAAMLQRDILPDLLEPLRPEKFIDPQDREIAGWLTRQVSAGGEISVEQWLGQDTESAKSDDLRKLVSELLVQETSFLKNEGAVDDRVRKILDYWKKKETREKIENLAKRIDAGETVDSEEWNRLQFPCT